MGLKLNPSEIRYYLFFSIIECGEALNIGPENSVFLVFAIMAFFFFLYRMAVTKLSLRELAIIAFLGILGGLIYWSTGKAGGILSIIAIMGLKEVDSGKLLRLSFYIRLAFFLLLLFLTSIGIAENKVITGIREGRTIARYSMGFSHPNQFHLAFIILLLLIMYLYYDMLGIIWLTILGGVNLLVYTITLSRTSAFVGFFAILMMLWFKSSSFCKLKKLACLSILPLGLLASFLPALLYDKLSFIWTIDRIMQWRITFNRHYLYTYPIRLLGNNLNSDPIILDCGYVELLVNYGIVFMFLYIFAYMILIHRFLKKGMYRELLLLVCLSVYGITEAFIPNLFVNLSMVFFGELIFEPDRKQSEESV